MNVIELAERGLLPDFLIRRGIRRLLAERLSQQRREFPEDERAAAWFARRLRDEPLAVGADAANQQHYEVPAEFYQRWLGPRLKYSCCWFDSPETPLEAAEERMLELTCQRAEIENGQRILELGCGWGSLSLWLAHYYPHVHVTAVSNSLSQRRFIESRAREQGLKNIDVRTCDIREFEPGEQFDRVVSVEMFEHVRNWRELMRRVSTWLEPKGKLFFHVFCHRELPYWFTDDGPNSWMGRHFFTGGTMPSEDLPLYFQQEMTLARQWRVPAVHYGRTCEAWLERLDARRSELRKLAAGIDGIDDPARFVQRWRMFLMACAELFWYRGGEEWFVAHYLFENNTARRDFPDAAASPERRAFSM
ncbi:MAG: cyclopropane-fatty-acyl-phospholipid synthase family protein [Pirellulaceae bacterium]